MPGGELGAEARQPGVGAAGSTAVAVQAWLFHFILFNFSADKKFSILFSTIAIMATPVADRSLPDNAAGLAVAELQVDDKPENSEK